MLLPWYGIPFSRGLSVTGLDSFGFADAALLITVGAAVVAGRPRGGRPQARAAAAVGRARGGRRGLGGAARRST